MHQFFRRARADNSGVGGGIWPKFELKHAYMHVLVTCKTEDDRIKNKLECSQDFSHYKSMGIFLYAQGQLTPQSMVRSCRISNSSEMLWMSSLPASMKNIRSKNEGARVFTIFSSLLPYGSYLLQWKPEFKCYLVQNLMQSIPHPNNASDKIWLNSECWLRRYSYLKV